MDWNFPSAEFHSGRLATMTVLLCSIWTGRVEVEVGSRSRSRGTKGAVGGETGFLVVEPKNAWSERERRRGWNRDAGWSGRAVERRPKPRNRRDSEFQLLRLPFLRLFCNAPGRPLSLYGWGASLSGAQDLNLLLPSVSQFEKGSPRGDVGRDGAGEGTTGCGWRKRKERRGGGRYLFRSEEDGERERGVETRAEIG